MIDLKRLLNDYENVEKELARRNFDKQKLEKLKELCVSFKTKRMVLESYQAQRNKKSEELANFKRQGWENTELQAQCDTLKADIAASSAELDTLEKELENLLFLVPNTPDSKTPDGKDENDNVEIARILEPREFNFKPKEHWELAEQNGWIDFTRGVKLAKSRFAVFASLGAKLERALINYMLDFNAKRGFVEFGTPAIANAASLFGTGQLPKFEKDLFKIASFSDEDLENAPDSIESETKKDKKPDNADYELYLIPTAEVTLTNLYRDEILAKSDLPKLMTAYTPCFRKEAGSAGRDTRGIIRQHQFDKVELVALCEPQDSDEIQQKMVNCASDLLKSLGLPHRLMQLCAGDMGFSAANTIDIEVWLPAQNCYREISSISNTRDFQARRAKIRYKGEDKKNHLVHTLNGSSLAVGRTLVAIMENYQKENGEIEIPEVLKPYLREI